VPWSATTGLLLVQQHAVAVEGESQAPAPIPLAQVLQGGIPHQPVEKQGLALAQVRGTDQHQPGILGAGLGVGQGLNLVQPPLQAGAGELDRLAPWRGGVGREPMAARAERRQRDLDPTIAEMAEALGRVFVDLQGDVGAGTQVRIGCDRPVLDLQSQGPGGLTKHRSIWRAHQRQPGPPAIKATLQLLDGAGCGDLLQCAAGGRDHRARPIAAGRCGPGEGQGGNRAGPAQRDAGAEQNRHQAAQSRSPHGRCGG